jgi:hypothetical protein
VTADTARSQRICLLAYVVYRIQLKLYTVDHILISNVLHNKLFTFTFTMFPLPPPINVASVPILYH